MAIQDFTAGQVLTAAQMDSLQANDYNQTVSTKTANYTLVAADKGTRVVMNAAGATTITVNTSLFTAGDTLQLQNIGAGVTTVTAGTATVSSAGPLAIPQYGSGTLYFTSAGVSIFFPSAGPAASSGMTLIQAATTTTAASVTVSNIFSATYSLYKVFITITSGTTGYNGLRFSTSGTPNTSSSYSFTYAGSDGNANYQESSLLTPQDKGVYQQNQNGNGFTELTVSNPFQSAVTRTVFNTHSFYGGATQYAVSGGILFNGTTSFDGIHLFNQNGNTFTYTTTVYGLAIS
jgi:hypothetical protein